MDENVKHGWAMVSIGAVLHFLVDGLCLCCLYLACFPFTAPRLLGIFILYNVLAFVTQPFTGLWADRMKERHWMLLLSVLLLTLGVLVTSLHSSFSPYILPVLLGMGNSLFHVWGGKQVVLKMGNDIRALGVFVSTGAFGLAVSMSFFSWSLLYTFLILLCLLSLIYLRLEMKNETKEISALKGNHNSTLYTLHSTLHNSTLYTLHSTLKIFFLLLIVAFVMFRSFLGESFTSNIVKDNGIILIIGLTAMLGKMAGGWIARGMGVVWAFVLVLAVALGCLVSRSSDKNILLTGLFAINCTMPVTLFWANKLLKGREGLAFGLLAAALIPGYLMSTLLKGGLL